MLRDYIYSLDPTLLEWSFGRFDIAIPKRKGGITLLEFRIISPDSFMWRFLIDRHVYYLYAEDFVAGLDDIEEKIVHATNKQMNLEFIRAKEAKDFHESEPYMNSAVYEPPIDEEQMMKFAIDSGYDFVFLCKSDEDISDAFFNG
jgi:hypothetical protein